MLGRYLDLINMRAFLNDVRLTPVDIGVYTHLCHQRAGTPHALSKNSTIPKETMRSSIARLMRTGWVIKLGAGPGGGTIVHPWMPPEVERLLSDELERIRYEVADFGEWLLKRILDLIVNDRTYLDNARP